MSDISERLKNHIHNRESHRRYCIVSEQFLVDGELKLLDEILTVLESEEWDQSLAKIKELEAENAEQVKIHAEWMNDVHEPLKADNETLSEELRRCDEKHIGASRQIIKLKSENRQLKKEIDHYEKLQLEILTQSIEVDDEEKTR